MNPESSYRRRPQPQPDIEAEIAKLASDVDALERKPFRFWDWVGIGVASLIVVGTTVAVIATLEKERDAANAPKVEIPLPHGYRYIDMPGSQTDVITFCDAGNRIYKDAGGTKGEAVAVIPNDPACVGS